MRGSDRLRDHRISDVSPFEKGHIGRRHTGTVWILILCRKLCSRNGILPEERQKELLQFLRNPRGPNRIRPLCLLCIRCSLHGGTLCSGLEKRSVWH